MSIANLKRSASGRNGVNQRLVDLILLGTAIVLIVAAIVLGSGVGSAAPASPTTGPATNDPNPFGGLTSSVQETAPPGSPALNAAVDRGLREGHSAWLPGLPAPTQPR